MDHPLDYQDYQDYRDYLKDRYTELKAKNPKAYTYLNCARKLNSSKSFLQLIFMKKRHLGAEKVAAVAGLLKLSDAQRELVFLKSVQSSCRDSWSKKYIQQILSGLNSQRQHIKDIVGVTLAEKGHSPLFENPLAMTLHALVRLPDFKMDAKWIRSKLSLNYSEDEIKNAFAFLLDSKAIVEEDKRFHCKEFSHQLLDPFAVAEGYKIYNIGLSRASQSLDDPFNHRPCQYYMAAIACDEKSQQEIFFKFNEFKNQLLEISNSCKDPDGIYFISNNIFCLNRWE